MCTVSFDGSCHSSGNRMHAGFGGGSFTPRLGLGLGLGAGGAVGRVRSNAWIAPAAGSIGPPDCQ